MLALVAHLWMDFVAPFSLSSLLLLSSFYSLFSSQTIFRTEALSLGDLVRVVLMTSSVLIADETRKLLERTHKWRRFFPCFAARPASTI